MARPQPILALALLGVFSVAPLFAETTQLPPPRPGAGAIPVPVKRLANAPVSAPTTSRQFPVVQPAPNTQPTPQMVPAAEVIEPVNIVRLQSLANQLIILVGRTFANLQLIDLGNFTMSPNGNGGLGIKALVYSKQDPTQMRGVITEIQNIGKLQNALSYLQRYSSAAVNYARNNPDSDWPNISSKFVELRPSIAAIPDLYKVYAAGLRVYSDDIKNGIKIIPGGPYTDLINHCLQMDWNLYWGDKLMTDLNSMYIKEVANPVETYPLEYWKKYYSNVAAELVPQQ